MLSHKEVEKVIQKILSKKRRYNRVIIKPNFCFAKNIRGVVTNPELVAYVTRYFSSRSKEVLIVESDNLLFSMDKAFDNLGIRKIAEREGAKTINLSRCDSKEYSKYLFPNDLFVNLPVLKTHEFTLMSCALKNMFGLLPDRKRVKHHPNISKILIKLCKLFKNQLIIVDGIKAMEGHGPTRGKVIDMNILIGGTNPAAVDQVVCRIMKIHPSEVQHVLESSNVLNKDGFEIKCDGVKLEELIREFERPQLDPLSAAKIWIWKHKIPNDIFFVSPLYPIVHFVGKKFRRILRAALKMEKID